MQDIEKKTILNRLTDSFKSNYAEYKKNTTTFNEAATRTEYIDPFLKILGWDINNEAGKPFTERDIVPEEPVNSTDRPDYTAKLNGVDILFIEAKKPNVDIFNNPEPAKQVRRYGWNAGHKVSILTNFEYLAIYETTSEPMITDSVSNYRYKLYHYEEYSDKFDEIYNLISLDSVQKGRFENWTNSIISTASSTTALDNVFLNQLNDWRLMIGSDLYSSGNNIYTNSKRINSDVQTFLNQLIFLRFAEDNKFEPNNLLRTQSLTRNDFINLLTASEQKYNSGIFEKTDIINSLSNETITSIVSQLYYPNNSYDFKIINLMILGSIYENFLQSELIIKDEEIILEKTKQAKIKSIVSTPEPMVRYIVKKALNDVIQDKSPEAILNLKVGDLAVGSGTFLIGAFDYIEDYLVDWYATSTDLFPTKSLVPYQIKRDLIKKVLIGFDIDPHAVQLTKFSLFLRLLRNEKKERFRNFRPILPSLDTNIICGNSLVTDNQLDILSLSLDVQVEINPLRTETNNHNFDVILGNPPYLKKEDIVNVIPIAEQEVYESNYISSFEMYDKYFLFIEAAIRNIKHTGKVVLLIPNKFRTVKAGLKLREYLLNSNFITEIIDFGDLQLFKGRLTYLAVVTFELNETDLLDYGKVSTLPELNDIAINSFPISSLEKDTWFLTDDAVFAEQYINLLAFPKITSEYKVFTGIQSSKNDIYSFNDSNILRESDEIITYLIDGEEVEIEKNILKRFYKPKKGETHFSYQLLNTRKNIIFPYSEGKLFSINKMQSDFPNTWKYLQSKKAELLPKHLGGNRSVPHGTVDTWYHYGRSQNFSIGDYSEKILVGVMSNKPNFNIDNSQTLFESGGTAGQIGIMAKETTQYTNEFLVAWLSHPLADEISKILGSKFDGGFYSHGKKEIEKMPLIPINFSDDFEKRKVEEITSLVGSIYSISNRLNLAYDELSINALTTRKKQTISRVNNQLNELLELKGIIINHE